MGVRSPTKVSWELGFPKLVCRGVNDVIGEVILVEGSCPVVFKVPVEVSSVECDPGGDWWPPTYSTWTPTIASFIFSVSAQFTIFSSFSGPELLELF
jgi:hypothetical protein